MTGPQNSMCRESCSTSPQLFHYGFSVASVHACLPERKSDGKRNSQDVEGIKILQYFRFGDLVFEIQIELHKGHLKEVP